MFAMKILGVLGLAAVAASAPEPPSGQVDCPAATIITITDTVTSMFPFTLIDFVTKTITTTVIGTEATVAAEAQYTTADSSKINGEAPTATHSVVIQTSVLYVEPIETSGGWNNTASATSAGASDMASIISLAAAETIASSDTVSSTTASTLSPSSRGTSTSTSSVSSYNTSTAPSAAATAVSSVCPNARNFDLGNFTLTFDDAGHLNQNGTITGAPLFAPYHYFNFGEDISVVPLPVVPYVAETLPELLEFWYDSDTIHHAPLNGTIFAYDLSQGNHGCYQFNVYGASMGCNSTNGFDCKFTFTGAYTGPAGPTSVVATQSITVPACKTLSQDNCHLVPITLDPTFTGLTTLTVGVTVDGVPASWWMDDLALGWTNNTCDAATCRFQHVPFRPWPSKIKI